MPAGLLHVTIFAEVLRQAALRADARGPAREGRQTHWGELARGVKEDANAMGTLIRRLGASPMKAKRPHRSNTFSK